MLERLIESYLADHRGSPLSILGHALPNIRDPDADVARFVARDDALP